MEFKNWQTGLYSFSHKRKLYSCKELKKYFYIDGVELWVGKEYMIDDPIKRAKVIEFAKGGKTWREIKEGNQNVKHMD